MPPTPAAGRVSAPQPSPDPDTPPSDPTRTDPSPATRRRILLAGILGAAGATAAACSGVPMFGTAKTATLPATLGTGNLGTSGVGTAAGVGTTAGTGLPAGAGAAGLPTTAGSRAATGSGQRSTSPAPARSAAGSATTGTAASSPSAPSPAAPSPSGPSSSARSSTGRSSSAPTAPASGTAPPVADTAKPAPRGPVAKKPSVGTKYPDRDASYAGGGAAPKTPTVPAKEFHGAAEAAGSTVVNTVTILDTTHPELHLLRRATLGPSADDLADVTRLGIDGWLAAQLTPDSIDDGVADGVWSRFHTASMSPTQVRAAIPLYSWEAMVNYSQATLARQIWSRRQLFEVMVDFWANHLNVTMPSDGSWDVGTSYHNDVIRGHALGSFTDMLTAAVRHPGLLRYLNNDQSTKDSVNENLGRELLELHTVGVDAGYTETDVRNSAYILSGRTVNDSVGAFLYDGTRHWTGPVQVLGFSSVNGTPDGGLAVGDAYLRYLATHPSTAAHLARKLAVRFVSDTPQQSLVDRLAAVYLSSGTQIGPMLETLFRSAEFWAQPGQKTRRPLENVVASMRALGVTPGADPVKGLGGLYWQLQQLGQQPLAWGPPNGYPDVAAAWNSAGGTLGTWNAHRGMVQGWYQGFGYMTPTALVAGSPATVGEWIDALCMRLAHQPFGPLHRAALLTFLGTTADAPVTGSPVASLAPHVAPLVLDSAYVALH